MMTNKKHRFFGWIIIKKKNTILKSWVFFRGVINIVHVGGPTPVGSTKNDFKH
jgi:hypothetical protein